MTPCWRSTRTRRCFAVGGGLPKADPSRPGRGGPRHPLGPGGGGRPAEKRPPFWRRRRPGASPPTQEEIEQYLQETVYTAYELPEEKEQIDNYCASAEISFEEYVADLRGQAPPCFLAKAKLKEVVMEEYCQAHGLPYDRMNPPQEAQEAVEAYQDQLLADHQGRSPTISPEPQAFYPRKTNPEGKTSLGFVVFSKFSCPFPVSVVH